jgi:hypothetical protein
LRWAALCSEATTSAVTRSGNPFASGNFRRFDQFFRCCAALECVSRFVWRKNDGANFSCRIVVQSTPWRRVRFASCLFRIDAFRFREDCRDAASKK